MTDHAAPMISEPPSNRLTCSQCGITFCDTDCDTGFDSENKNKALGLALTFLAHGCAVRRIREITELAGTVTALLHPEPAEL